MSAAVFTIVAPNSMAMRAVCNSFVLPELYSQLQQNYPEHDWRIHILGSKDQSLGEFPDYVDHFDALDPVTVSAIPLREKLLRALSVRISKYLGLGYGNLVYRFNEIAGFYAHEFKKKMPRERQQREALAGNFVAPRFGWPFAKSPMVYRLIYRWFYSVRQRVHPPVAEYFRVHAPSRIVFWHVQSEIFRDYSVMARRHGIASVGVIGSWDRPSTKGPICPGCERQQVNNQVMKQELVEYHEIPENEIDVVGWPQMDAYLDQSLLITRKDYLQQIGLPKVDRCLLYTANCGRLGAHEPSLVEFLAREVEAGTFGDKVGLVIRAHPQDIEWQQRFAKVADKDIVSVRPAEMGNLSNLVNALHHADVVIATQGSVSLDAAALDRPIVNVAFDGDLNRSHSESVARWYDMDHYRPVVGSGGVDVVSNYAQLTESVQRYLDDPEYLSEGRVTLRALEIEPFTGDSSKRQVAAMLAK